MTKKLYMTKGLPGSGKSTWAKDMVDKMSHHKRVNKDDLRALLDNSKWTKGNESFILKIRDKIIEEALANGYHVICDDTNLSPKHQARMKELAHKHNAELVIKDFTDVPIEQCIANDLKRHASVGEKVIRKMYRDFLMPYVERPQPYYIQDKESVIICDIDGTLALMDRNLRGPFDWHKVGFDTINEPVLNVLRKFSDDGYKIFLFSGRDAVCEKETLEWLEKNYVPFYSLHMRDEGNCEKDTIIKERMFNKYIKDQYNVEFVLDDRKSVKRMWTSLGLFVLDCNQFDEEF